MKNAYVLVHHHGDDGAVSEGMILLDVAAKRFDVLEKAGLVREATADEVKKGYQPSIPVDESRAVEGKGPAGVDLDDPANADARRVAEEAQKFINQLRDDHAKALDAERDRAEGAEKAHNAAQAELATAEHALAEARAEIEQLKAGGAKQDKAPANKKAAEPANKGA